MQAMFAPNAPHSLAGPHASRLQLSRVGRDHPHRREVEAFIAEVYRQRYGAQLRSFLPHLLAYRDAAGALQAAVGLRYAREGRLFVEQYLDTEAQCEVARVQQVPVPRERLVEVGNFASRTPGHAREVIVRLTALLHHEGLRWVLFAATKQLRNTFDRLHLATVPLAPADPARLNAGENAWGCYYDAKPVVLLGDLASGYAYLQRRAAETADAQNDAAPHGSARSSAADSSERHWLLHTVLRSACVPGV
jgi:hypothetical protein